MHKIIAFCFIILLTGCQDASEALSAQDITNLLKTDRKISFSKGRFIGQALIRVDNTFAVDIPALGKGEGIWWVESEKICTRWKEFRKGKNLCATIGKFKDGSYEGRIPISNIHIGTFQFRN